MNSTTDRLHHASAGIRSTTSMPMIKRIKTSSHRKYTDGTAANSCHHLCLDQDNLCSSLHRTCVPRIGHQDGHLTPSLVIQLQLQGRLFRSTTMAAGTTASRLCLSANMITPHRGKCLRKRVYHMLWLHCLFDLRKCRSQIPVQLLMKSESSHTMWMMWMPGTRYPRALPLHQTMVRFPIRHAEQTIDGRIHVSRNFMTTHACQSVRKPQTLASPTSTPTTSPWLSSLVSMLPEK